MKDVRCVALEKIRVEEGSVDLDPLSWPQAAESDGTGKPETTGLPVVAAWTTTSHDFVRLPDIGAWVSCPPTS